jgi:phenylacetate-coenzyme A ligase PaaK-like adenylate-forming protein
MTAAAPTASETAAAASALDAHVREIVAWHFSPETGTPYWIEQARAAGWDPRREVRGFADLARFAHFDGEALRREPHERFVPRAYEGLPFTIFETGGTTGLPKQRIGWEDYKLDYAAFSDTLSDAAFPRGGYWLMVGPTGPRRLRLAIEFLANHRGSSCYFVDLDPRWVKKLIARRETAQAKAYMEHVVDQATVILRKRKVDALFTTPKLLEAIAERTSIPGAGVKGVFCGGTTMDPQTVRFLCEEVLEGKTQLVPVYGNTLMGLAHSRPLDDTYSITYYAPQPRAVLRVVDGEDTARTVGYDEWGRVELTTLTKELFMPRFLERDEGKRRPPAPGYPWDGVAEVRPYGAEAQTIVEGVY